MISRRAAFFGLFALTCLGLACNNEKKEKEDFEKAKKAVETRALTLDAIVKATEGLGPPKSKPSVAGWAPKDSDFVEVTELKAALEGKKFDLWKVRSVHDGEFDWLAALQVARDPAQKVGRSETDWMRKIDSLPGKLIVVLPKRVVEAELMTRDSFKAGEYVGEAWVFDTTSGQSEGGVAFSARSSKEFKTVKYAQRVANEDLAKNMRAAIREAMGIAVN